MKQKSIVWRVLAILLLAFLWGGNQSVHAKMKPWGKIDYSTGVFTIVYSDRPILDNYGKGEYPVFGVKREDGDYRNHAPASWIEKVVIDKSMADYHPSGPDIFDAFKNLYNLETIEGLEYLDVSEVESLAGFFEGCSSLTKVDLTSFDTRNVTRINDMFSGCSSLTTILVSDKFVTDNLNSYQLEDADVFSGCTSLAGDIPFDENKITGSYAKTKGGYFTNVIRPWATFADGTLTFRYGYKKWLADNEYRVYGNESTPDWLLSHKSSIKRVVFDPSFAEARPTSCYEWFLDCGNLETVEGLEYFNSSEVQTMAHMFSGCSYALKSLDLTKLDVQNVTSMFRMFYSCRALTELDLTGFNTAKVKNARGMFRECSSLTTIYADQMFTLPDDASSENMFTGCTSLKGDFEYDPNTTDKTYATVDGGYLTEKGNDRMWAKYADGTLTFNYGPKKKLDTDEYFVTYSLPGWHDKAGEIKKVVFDESFGKAKPTSCYAWFKDASLLTTIEGLENLNTYDATNLSFMFYGCSSLVSLDLTKLHVTQFVTDMSWMFCGCSSLTELNLVRLRRSFPKVTNFSRMFFGCSSLTELNFDKYLTTNAESMTAMFYGCSSLTSLDLTSFNTSKVWALNGMFYGCTSLKTLDLSSFDTYNCRYFGKMFYGCSNLVTIYATENFRFDPYRLDLESAYMFEGCNKLVGATTFNSYITNKAYAKVDGGYFTDKQYTRPWATFNNGQLIFWYGYKKDLGANEYLIHADPRDNTDLLAIMPQVKTAVFYNFRLYHPTSCASWFKGASQLTTISRLEDLDTSEVTDMSSMFEGCSSLASLDPYRMYTGKVTNMARMFKDCSSATLLNLYPFSTASATDMHDMFAGCTSLRTIVATNNFVTDNVENSADMFAGCTKLKGAIAFDASAVDKTYAKLDGGYFSKIADLNAWAAYSAADKTLTFQYGNKTALGANEYWLNDNTTEPGWNEYRNNTQKVVFDPSFAEARPTSCYQWFCYNSWLQGIEGLEYLNTANVSTMREMFSGCVCLGSLDLSHFNTEKVTDMNQMFCICNSLTSLDLSSFNTSKVTDMNNLFSTTAKLNKLKYVYFGDKFVVPEGQGSTIFNSLPSAVIHVTPGNYASLKAREDFADVNLRPYFSINAKSPFGTLCVPFGGTLAEGSFSGFDKLYRVKGADATEGTITLEETKTIEPGVAYVYRRNLPEDAAKSVVAFTVDDNVASVTEPQNDDNLMKGTFKSITAPEGSYLLQSDGNFHPVPAGNTTLKVGTYRAYLDLSALAGEGGEAGAKAYRMVFGDGEATGIGGIIADGSANGIVDNADQRPTTIYDLSGRRVNAPQKGGIYIVKGKKVIF